MHMIRTRNWRLICNSYLSTRTDIKSAAQIWSCFLHNPRNTRFIVAFAKRYAVLHQLMNSLPFQIGNVWFLFLGRQADISNVIFCWHGCTNISLTLLQVTTFIIVQWWSLRFLVRVWYICLINLDFVTDYVTSLSTAWTFLEKGCQWKLRQTTLPCLLPCFYRWPWCSKSTSIGAIICTRDTEVYILRIKHNQDELRWIDHKQSCFHLEKYLILHESQVVHLIAFSLSLRLPNSFPEGIKKQAKALARKVTLTWIQMKPIFLTVHWAPQLKLKSSQLLCIGEQDSYLVFAGIHKPEDSI